MTDSPTSPEHPRSKGGSSRGRQISARRVRDLITASIRDGHLAPDDPLAEEDLMELFDTSRGSVRAALTQLRDSGFVERKRRVGTKVTDLGVTLPISDIHTDTEHVIVTVLEQRLVPSFPLVRDRLHLEDETVRMIENTFSAEGQVIGLRTAYFSAALEFDFEIYRTPVRMSMVMRDFFGVTPGEVLVIVGSDIADAHTARVLGVAEGVPLIVREMTYYDSDGSPVETVFDRFRGDRVRLEATASLL
ncbi:GntR family transcriptional regulator [Frondihabitans cladoniiphilus]|uniref:GntR family transcriptional regulator n=1 Tax=Frondihabitans cladoniiphilus TaxID=715785 RepID=A0ABP8W395_9MICO